MCWLIQLSSNVARDYRTLHTVSLIRVLVAMTLWNITVNEDRTILEKININSGFRTPSEHGKICFESTSVKATAEN